MGEEPDPPLSIETLANRDPGRDSDPYADVDLTELPAWWRRAIEEHEAYGLRPYRPPRFADGTLKYEVVSRLEERHGIEVRLVGKNVGHPDDWVVFVGDDSVGTVEHRRSPEGYTVFGVSADDFVAMVEEYLDGPDRARGERR